MKEEKISLEELGREYDKHIALQQVFIDNCKAQITEAKKLGDFGAVEELKSNLQKFYEIKRELKEVSAHLKNYYKGEN